MKNSKISLIIYVSPQIRNWRPKFKLKHLFANQILFGLGLTFMLPIANLNAKNLDVVQQENHSIHTLATIKVQAVDEDQTNLDGHLSTKSYIGFLGEKTLMETPFNVISYTEKYIADRQARDITDVIVAIDPSVYSTGAFGVIAESYTIRGFNSSSTPAGKDTSFGGLYGVAPLYRASPEMFERIDVLKGPSAMLNGMPPGGTLGGNVNLIPKRAIETPLTRLTTTYMSNAQFGGHIDVGRRFGEDQAFGVRLNGVYRDGEGPIHDQDKKTQLLALGLDWRSKHARISADLYSSQDQNNGINRGVTLKSGVNVPKPPNSKTLLNPTWTFFDTKDKGMMVRGEYDFNPDWMGYVTAGMSKTEYSTLGAAKGEIQNEAGDILFNIAHLGFEYERKSAEMGLRGKFNTGNIGHAVSVNATHYRERDDEFGIRQGFKTDRLTNIYHPNWGAKPDRATVAPIFSNKEHLTSFGLADTLSIAQDQVQLTLGVRHQNIITESLNSMGMRNVNGLYDKSAWTPAAALLIKANQHLSFYTNYIQGLSSGGIASSNYENFGEIFSPYKTQQKEVGLKFDTANFSSSLSLYEIKTPSGYSKPNQDTSKKPIYSVDGEQRNRGIEWGFWGVPLQGVRVMGGMTYIEPKLTKTQNFDEAGKMATGVPKIQAKLGVEGDIDYITGLTLTANATAASKQYIDRMNTISVSGREVYSIGARYSTQIAKLPVTFRGGIENLTNKAYWSMPQFSSLMLGAPRTYLVSASFDF